MKKHLFLLATAATVLLTGCATQPPVHTYNTTKADVIIKTADGKQFTIEKPVQQTLTQDQITQFIKDHPANSCCIVVDGYQAPPPLTGLQKFLGEDEAESPAFRDCTSTLFINLRMANYKEIVVVADGDPANAVEIAHYF